MSCNHAVIWVDRAQARIIYFNADVSENLEIKAHSYFSHLHTNSGSPDSRHAAENKHFFNEIAEAAKGVEKILVMGPGVEKTWFVKHLTQHRPRIAIKVCGIEESDHPNEAQLLTHAREFFIKADQYERNRLSSSAVQSFASTFGSGIVINPTALIFDKTVFTAKHSERAALMMVNKLLDIKRDNPTTLNHERPSQTRVDVPTKTPK